MVILRTKIGWCVCAASLPILLLLAGSFTVQAEDLSSPKQFYGNNFALGAGDDAKGPAVARPKERAPQDEGARGSLPGFEEDHPGEEPAAHPAAQDQSIQEDLALGQKVNFVNTYINSEDEQHFDEKFKELLDVADKKGIELGIVYAVGAYPKFLLNLGKEIPPDLMRLAQHRAIFRVLKKAPEEYNVKLSPTWVVDTAEGKLVLEATGAMTNYFTKSGNFIVPSASNSMDAYEVEEVLVTPGSTAKSDNPVAAVKPPQTVQERLDRLKAKDYSKPVARP